MLSNDEFEKASDAFGKHWTAMLDKILKSIIPLRTNGGWHTEYEYFLIRSR
jgi:hypothetical protein